MVAPLRFLFVAVLAASCVPAGNRGEALEGCYFSITLESELSENEKIDALRALQDIMETSLFVHLTGWQPRPRVGEDTSYVFGNCDSPVLDIHRNENLIINRVGENEYFSSDTREYDGVGN